MSSISSYTPSTEDLVSVIKLLHDNGIVVSSSKKAYEELKQYEANPSFCILLSSIFASTSCPVLGVPLTVDWMHYRLLAGLTLKNNLSAARHALGEEAVLEVARSALASLSTSKSLPLSRVSAQIVVKVTELTSFSWWSKNGLTANLPLFLLTELLQGGEVSTIGALYTLQYIMEDLSKMVGEGSEQIIIAVSSIAQNNSFPLSLRKAAFRVCFNTYEQASFLDWNVDTLSPLQLGITKASWPFACVCTSLLESGAEGDVAFQLEILRSIYFLLQYFDYFPSDGSSVLSPSDQERLQRVWMGFALQTIGSVANHTEKTELVAAAIDVISGVLEAFEQDGGDVAYGFLTIPVANTLYSLIGALVDCSVLSDDEVEDILREDDYRIRSSRSGVSVNEEGGKEISEDKFLDDAAAAVTLRQSAIQCIESLCQFDEASVVSITMPRIDDLWKQTNFWKAKELGFVLYGAIAGSLAKNEALLPAFVEHVGRVVSDPAEHVCVTSMAIWALSCTLSNLYTGNKNLFETAANTLASQLESTSKRVQSAALTGLKKFVNVIEVYSSCLDKDGSFLYLEQFVGTLCRCLSVYHTSSLAQLVQLMVMLFPYWHKLKNMCSCWEIAVNAIRKERSSRASLFELSYIKAYIEGKPNAMLDKDILCIDSALVVLLSFYPDSSLAAEILKSWTGVLEDILQRQIMDDSELLQDTLLTCAGYIKAINTHDFHQHLSPVLPKLYSSALQVWKAFTRRKVKLCAVLLLRTVIEARLAANCPGSTGEEEQACVVEEIEKEEDLEMKMEMLKLGMLLVRQHPSELFSQRTYVYLNNVLRSDVYGESLLIYIDMAMSCCFTASCCSGALLPLTRVDVITQLLTQATNDAAKANATIQLSSLVSVIPTETLVSLLPDLLRLVYSWQQAAISYPGTVEELQRILKNAQERCGALLHQLLSEIPSGLREMIREMYNF